MMTTMSIMAMRMAIAMLIVVMVLLTDFFVVFMSLFFPVTIGFL